MTRFASHFPAAPRGGPIFCNRGRVLDRSGPAKLLYCYGEIGNMAPHSHFPLSPYPFFVCIKETPSVGQERSRALLIKSRLNELFSGFLSKNSVTRKI